MDLGLAGRIALVTAASRGLGFASAKALAGEGASLVVCAREPQRLEAAAAELQSTAPWRVRIEQVALDVSAPDAAARLVSVARERFGRLDVLVTNAGGPPAGSFVKVGDADWERAFQLTLMSVVRLARE